MDCTYFGIFNNLPWSQLLSIGPIDNIHCFISLKTYDAPVTTSLNHNSFRKIHRKTNGMSAVLNEIHRKQQLSNVSRERLLLSGWMCCQTPEGNKVKSAAFQIVSKIYVQINNVNHLKQMTNTSNILSHIWPTLTDDFWYLEQSYEEIIFKEILSLYIYIKCDTAEFRTQRNKVRIEGWKMMRYAIMYSEKITMEDYDGAKPTFKRKTAKR